MNRHDGPNRDEDENIEIEIDWSDLRSVAPEPEPERKSNERITLPPPVPSEEYAAELMATAEGSWEDLPPPSVPSFAQALPTQNAPALDGRRGFHESFDHVPESGLRHSHADFASRPTPIHPVRHDERTPLTDDGAMHEVRGRFALRDYSGALVMAESILDSDPGNAEAKQYAERCRKALVDLYVSRLGGTLRVPRLAVAPDQLHWLALDHRAGFLLSLVDGMSSIEDILDISGMTHLEALRTLFELVQQDVIHVS